jgi:methionyl aminopeptidase
VIVLKSDAEIDAMRAAGRLSADLLDMIGEHVRAGVTTLELNDIAHEYTIAHGGIPAPLNYKGFPKSICTSVNEVVCHGIPTAKQKLKDGDIINIDVTSIVDGYYGDTSRMYYVGNPTPVGKRVSECARECLFKGMGALLDRDAAAKGKVQLREGARIGDIGAAIQAHAEGMGFSVVREFVGHGIGRKFHEDPQISHFGTAGKGPRLTSGMVFTIEPMINEGHWKTKVLRDGWTAITIDGGLSAQWEHTMAITSSGAIILLTESELEKSTRPGFF